MKRIKRAIKNILCFLSKKKTIVFESNPEFSCNTLPVYEEMVRRGIRRNYQVFWLVEDRTKYKDDKSGNKYLNYEEKGLYRLKQIYVMVTAKAVVFSNRFSNKQNERQLVINLMHGSPIKKTPGYEEGDTCDYVITQSKYFNKKVAEVLEVPEYKLVPLGFPRDDVLNKSTGSKKKIGISKDNKLIVWMPTFRKNKNCGIITGELNKLGVPMLDSVDKFESLNNLLKNNNIELIIKLHPVEDTSLMQLGEFSNLHFISDRELNNCGIKTVYELLAESDALLTDYSSVYYDYLATGKPIGLVVPDLDEYDQRNGFVYGEYKSFVKGNYITNLEEFALFMTNLATNIDPSADERKMAMDKYCQYRDFDSTTRVVDFILDRI